MLNYIGTHIGTYYTCVMCIHYNKLFFFYNEERIKRSRNGKNTYTGAVCAYLDVLDEFVLFAKV